MKDSKQKFGVGSIVKITLCVLFVAYVVFILALRKVVFNGKNKIEFNDNKERCNSVS